MSVVGPLSITKHRDPVEQVLRVATQMLEGTSPSSTHSPYTNVTADCVAVLGLGYIHTVIVSSHRDLKPTNVVVASDGVVSAL